jgi:hypothetical protein
VKGMNGGKLKKKKKQKNGKNRKKIKINRNRQLSVKNKENIYLQVYLAMIKTSWEKSCTVNIS